MEVKDRDKATTLDFSPKGLLQILSQSDRARVSGVTIDSAKTRVIDDGISVRQQGKGWVIEVSIADVPAMVPEGSILEDKARDLGYERKGLDGEVERIFPWEFLVNHVSLKE
ncbi:MAG TPA: RNB domain-containing ribonuclease, partial [Micavibrio sp.]